MRHFWSLLLTALLTARTASAQVASVPPSAGVAAVGSASAGAAPMAQYAALRKGDIHAALTFIHTPALQEWLWTSRPAQAEGVLGLAHRLADFGQMARAYTSNPSEMRRAMISREGESLIQKPEQVRAIFALNPLLKGSVETVRKAYCAWGSLEDQERQALESRGHTEKAWHDYELPRRVGILRKIWWDDSLRSQLPESVLDPSYASTLRAFLKHAGGYLSSDDYWAAMQTTERAERLAMRVAETRARFEASGDEAALRGLADVAEQTDVNQARAAFNKIFEGTKIQTEIPTAVPKAVLSELAARLPAAVRALAEGTPAAGMLDEAERLKPLHVAFGKMPAGVVAHYLDKPNLIEFSEEDVSKMLRSEGRRPEELLSDPALLERYVLAVAPLYVHEATHARQDRLLARRGFKENGHLYQQASEVEAFSLQLAFAHAYEARAPEAAKTIRELSSRPELLNLVHAWLPVDGPIKRVRGSYESLQAGDRAWSSMVRAERNEFSHWSPLRAQEELARRRRLPAAERLRIERNGLDSGKIALAKTSVLRRAVALADRSSRALTTAVTAANDEIMANARRALKTFYSLKP